MVAELNLNSPKDVRRLVCAWIAETCELKHFPFDNGGTLVQLLNTWLRAYDAEKIPEIEKRLKLIEERLDGKK